MHSVSISTIPAIILSAFVTLNFALNIGPLPIPSPVITPVQVPTSNSSNADLANFAGNVAGNALCEANPTHLLCKTSVYIGHTIEQNLPPALVLRHCDVFVPSPHCCAQFCLPGTAGVCDQATGACFCNGPSGPPNVCQMLVVSQNYTTPNMNDNDRALLALCATKCQNTTYQNCNKAAAVTDGIVGSVCFCYCDKE